MAQRHMQPDGKAARPENPAPAAPAEGSGRKRGDQHDHGVIIASSEEEKRRPEAAEEPRPDQDDLRRQDAGRGVIDAPTPDGKG